MADEADQASVVIESSTAHNVASVQAQMEGAGREYCSDCDEVLSAARRAAAPWAVRCVPCADIKERKEAHRR